VLKLKNLSKRREQAGSVFELSIPDLHLKPGQMAALVGDSGCGKSTLLDMLALVLEPTGAQGFVLEFGRNHPKTYDIQALWAAGDESALARIRREHMGYILQTGGLLPFLGVAANVSLPARIKGVQEYQERMQHLAERLGIIHCLQRSPDSLSIGQRQRAAILRALVHSPELILADEPTASVDKSRAGQIMHDLRTISREEDTAVVVVTHDTDLASEADLTYTFVLEQESDSTVHAQCLQVH
jgi:putative ABC transport system ATP-binding protein